MLVITENRLAELRKEMLRPKVSREQLAVAAGVSMITVRNAEVNYVSYPTAKTIVQALNRLRKKQGLSSNWTVESVGIRLSKEE